MSFIPKLLNLKVIVIIFVIGFAVYANSLTNPFFADDIPYVRDNKYMRSISNITSFFTQGTYPGEESKQYNNFYRPVPSAIFSFIYFFSTDNTFGYHFTQVLLHIINTILIYIFFNYFFQKNVSFLLSLIFLVHPINTEAIIYISAFQEPLFVLFGLSALLINMYSNSKLLAGFIGSILLSLSLLSKETGVVFLFALPLCFALNKKSKVFTGIIQVINALLIYGFLRFIVAQIYFPQSPVVPIMSQPFLYRLISIPKIIFFYLKTFFFPKDLVIFQSWVVTSYSFTEFFLPLIIDVLFFVSVIIMSFILARQHIENVRKVIFFLALFVLGLGAHLQIIPLDQTVADRWFYFPIIGLLGVIGMIYKHVEQKVGFKPKLFYPVIFVILIVLSLRVVVRNSNWKNQFDLISHDSQYNRESHQIEKLFGDYYSKQGNYAEAEKHLIRSTEIFPSLNTYTSLGVFYLGQMNYIKAADAFNRVLRYDQNYVPAWVYLTLSKYKLGDTIGAKKVAENASSISPNNKSITTLLNIIEKNLQININK